MLFVSEAAPGPGNATAEQSMRVLHRPLPKASPAKISEWEAALLAHRAGPTSWAGEAALGRIDLMAGNAIASASGARCLMIRTPSEIMSAVPTVIMTRQKDTSPLEEAVQVPPALYADSMDAQPQDGEPLGMGHTPASSTGPKRKTPAPSGKADFSRPPLVARVLLEAASRHAAANRSGHRNPARDAATKASAESILKACRSLNRSGPAIRPADAVLLLLERGCYAEAATELSAVLIHCAN